MKFQILLFPTLFYQILFKKMKMPENCHKGPFLMGTIKCNFRISVLQYFDLNDDVVYKTRTVNCHLFITSEN